VRQRLRVRIRGAVQGVGFRPFVFRAASELCLTGFVQNDTAGVIVEAEGPRAALEQLLARLSREAPPRAILQTVTHAWIEAEGDSAFEIRLSGVEGERTAVVLPEIATCAACLAEVFDPHDRRYRYPFANCTDCGPRFTIVRSLPYDRPNTTMRGFVQCERCQAEYDDPRNRRFHAQPNACPACGPSLALWDPAGTTLAVGDEALRRAAAAIVAGRIVALKGLGGFLLVADASRSEAVRRLRERKHRPEKPFALMAPNLEAAASLCELSEPARRALLSPEAPIVLCPKRLEAAVAPEVAPGTPNLGVMLPYTPLHHLLLDQVGAPVVATSGNLSDEPICIDEREALRRLAGIPDVLLVHDRPIERHADDSIVWIVRDEPRLVRRARGYAPLPVLVDCDLPTILAVGAHMKATVALSVGRQVFIGQHIGDMETPEAIEAFERAVADLLRLYEAEPSAVAHDLHPDYATTRWALACGRPAVGVQHHHAHLASCLAENGETGSALGVTWDGTGFGEDGAVWGGEFLSGDAAAYTRVAHLRPFRLLGGEAAVQEPRRSGLALLYETLGDAAFSREDLPVVRALAPGERPAFARMVATGAFSPSTTSAGRLFDGVAALVGLQQRASFEGQAAMALEAVADAAEDGSYPLPLVKMDASPWILDWRSSVEAILEDLRRGQAVSRIAARFHRGLVEGIVAVARRTGEPTVALTGGCFQNRLLTERAARRLEAEGFRVLLHRCVPTNDGGISLGQILVAARRRTRQSGSRIGV
jgi:hydrogenase maturation protein HypF